MTGHPPEDYSSPDLAEMAERDDGPGPVPAWLRTPCEEVEPVPEMPEVASRPRRSLTPTVASVVSVAMHATLLGALILGPPSGGGDDAPTPVAVQLVMPPPEPTPERMVLRGTASEDMGKPAPAQPETGAASPTEAEAAPSPAEAAAEPDPAASADTAITLSEVKPEEVKPDATPETPPVPDPASFPPPPPHKPRPPKPKQVAAATPPPSPEPRPAPPKPAALPAPRPVLPLPTAAPPRSVSPGVPATRDEYLAYLVTLTRRHLDLIPLSLIGGRRGETQVAMVVLDNGTVRDLRVTRSSGYPEIDRRVIEMIEAVGRFPPPPQWFQGAALPLTFRYTFPESAYR